MAEQKSQKSVPPAWHVPVVVGDVPETGQHFDLEPDAAVRAAVAGIAGLRDLPRLNASFDVMPHGTGGLHVLGSVSATVGQTCVVTLEPLENEVEERIDLIFLSQPTAEPSDDAEKSSSQTKDVDLEAPEPLMSGTIDLGALATEFLILGLDPYPRKPGAVFQAPHDDKPDPGPFAALAKLTERGS